MFPTLQHRSVGYLNLNECARQYSRGRLVPLPKNPNPFLEPEVCSTMVNQYHKDYGIGYSYGGWMEDRSFVWRGNYLEEKKNFIHLGMDCNAPIGTEVTVDQKGIVVRIDNDTPEVGGWGTRVFFRLEAKPVVLIYAHLASVVHCRVGDFLSENTQIGTVGMPEENGGWYPHVHVQTMILHRYEKELETNLRDLDGYGNANDKQILARRFPDPIRYVRFA